MSAEALSEIRLDRLAVLMRVVESPDAPLRPNLWPGGLVVVRCDGCDEPIWDIAERTADRDAEGVAKVCRECGYAVAARESADDRLEA